MKYLLFVCAFLLPLAASAKDLPKIPTVALDWTNSVTLDTDITTGTVDTIMFSLFLKRTRLDPSDTLYLVLKTDGGDMDASIVISDSLVNVPNLKIICLRCASGGVAIFETKGFPRLITEHSAFMTHEPYYETMGAYQVTCEGIGAFRAQTDLFNARIYTRAGISKEVYTKNVRGRDWRVFGTDILKEKFADSIIKLTCDPYVKTILRGYCE